MIHLSEYMIRQLKSIFNKATVISIQYVFSGTLKKAMEVTVEMRSSHIFAHLRKKSQGTLARSCSSYNLNYIFTKYTIPNVIFLLTFTFGNDSQ